MKITGVWSKTEGFPMFLEACFILSKSVQDKPKVVMKDGLAGVQLCANLIAAQILREVPALIIVIRFNDDLFQFAHSFAQIEGLPERRPYQGVFTNSPMSFAQQQ